MKYRLSDLAQIKYGKDHKKLNSGTIPVYGSGGIMRYVDTYLYDSESVLIPRKGSLNNLFFVKGKFWTVDTIFWTIINTDIIIPKYLYYKLKTIDLASMNVGSAVPSLTAALLNEISISIPDLQEQRRVLNVIEPFENKISLNTKINDNLVTLSYTIWKEDFKYKLLNKGSRNTSFLDYGKIISGGTPSKKEKSYYENGNIPWITPKDLSNNSNIFISRGQNNITQLGLKNSSAKLMPDNSILFSSRAPIGYIGITKNPLSTNQGFKSIVPAKKEYLEFLYFLLLFLKSEIINNANGSTFKEISLSGMKAIKFPNIEQNKIILFHEKISQILNKVRLNEEENIELGKIKNALLNKFF